MLGLSLWNCGQTTNGHQIMSKCKLTWRALGPDELKIKNLLGQAHVPVNVLCRYAKSCYQQYLIGNIPTPPLQSKILLLSQIRKVIIEGPEINATRNWLQARFSVYPPPSPPPPPPPQQNYLKLANNFPSQTCRKFVKDIFSAL